MGRNVFRLSPDGYRLIGGRDYPEISCIRVRSRAGQLPTPRLAGRSQSSRRPRKCQLCFRRGSAFGIYTVYTRARSRFEQYALTARPCRMTDRPYLTHLFGLRVFRGYSDEERENKTTNAVEMSHR